MNAYMNLNRTLSMGKIDPVSLQEFKQDVSTHPRSIMTIRRSHGKPCPISVQTMIDIIEHGNESDPITRRKFSSVEVERAYLYQKCIKTFPDYKMSDINPEKLYQKWIDSKIPGKFSQEEKTKISLEASCFLQPRDLVQIFHDFGSEVNMTRAKAKEYLKKNKNVGWLLRTSSVKDTEYEKAYTISYRLPTGQIVHVLIIHKIGEGFYWGVRGIHMGESAGKKFTGYTYIFPTIVSLLESTVM